MIKMEVSGIRTFIPTVQKKKQLAYDIHIEIHWVALEY